MDISPEKVAYIILKSRQYEAKGTLSWSETDTDMNEDGAINMLEDRRGDTAPGEAAQFISNLNEDEKISLVVLTWIGRGSYEPDDWDRAVETARRERINKTDKYLLGMPLLPDFLEEGLEAMGYAIEDLGDGLL